MIVDHLIEAGPLRLTAAAVSAIAWLALCAGTIARERRRLRHEREQRAALAPEATHAAGPGDHPGANRPAPVLVSYASQTGTAETLAWHSARVLRALGAPVQLLPAAELTVERLHAGGTALFIVSTYGEGDPPDNASSFVGRLLGSASRLDALSYAVLALGDRQYANFCAFGHQLANWLGERGGRALFETIEVDNQDASALQRWQAAVTALGPATADREGNGGIGAMEGFGADAGTEPIPDVASALVRPTFEPWRITVRERVNPAEPEHPLYRVVLTPGGDRRLPQWHAGDLALVRHPDDPAHPREYSIASLPDDGGLELIVRQERHPDGTLGLCSGLLTEGCAVSDAHGEADDADAMPADASTRLDVALRANRNFRLDGNERRPLILIGNGSGIAGLLALIRQARREGGRGHWLIFGERDPVHDRPAHALIEGWLADGTLAHADRVFSRGASDREYVQHRLASQQQRLREAIDADAAIYVCGSAVGMAGGVDQVLRDALGSDRVEALRDAGRYRRDVY